MTSEIRARQAAGERLLTRLSIRWALPGDALADIPSLRMQGDHQLQLRGYGSITCCEKDCIQIQGAHWALKIYGEELEIQAMAGEDLQIGGKISALNLL